MSEGAASGYPGESRPTEVSRSRHVAAGGRGYTLICYSDGSTVAWWDEGGVTQTLPTRPVPPSALNPVVNARAALALWRRAA